MSTLINSVHVVQDTEGAIVRITGEVNGGRFSADRYGWTEGSVPTRITLRESDVFGPYVREFAESIPFHD